MGVIADAASNEERTASNEELVVEQQSSTVGWMVFSGCEGEEPTLVAFFMGPRAKELAEELHGRRDEDGNQFIFDPGIAPAALVSEVGEGGLFAANHYDDDEGKAALARACGVQVEDWGD